MIALKSVVLVALVSQATSALILTLLAWADRRDRGLRYLAVACVLHSFAIFLMPMWRGSNRWLPEAISAAILPVMLSLIHRGLSHFLGRHGRPSVRATTTVVVLAALAASVAPWSRIWSIQIAWVTAIGIMACTVRMLWQPTTAALRVPARVTAAFFMTIIGTFALRLPLEPHSASSPWMILLRELTMVEITLLAFSFLAMYLAESQRRTNHETRLDPLTGLLNRRAMEERAAEHIRSARRRNRPLALLMMDLDGFKLLNDTWGHGVGDRALSAVGYVLLSAANNSGNAVGRLGGEEFAMLLPDHTVEAAQSIAEQLRLAIAALSVAQGARRVSFTISIGVAAWNTGEINWRYMLDRADTALYRAKRGGRNRVEICEYAMSLA